MTVILILSCALLVCLILSAFFSGSEMAYSSANRIRLENLAEEKNRKAARALNISQNYDKALSAILIGNNLVNIAASSIGSVLVYFIFGKDDSYAWISTVCVTILVIIFGETIPKIKSKKNATTVAMRYSFALEILMIILKPAVWLVVGLVNTITAPLKGQEEDENDDEYVEELQSIVETAETEGIFDEDDSELIQNAIEFPDVSAFEVMTSRVDVQAIDIDDTWEEILDFISSTPYSRIPVYQDSIDNIIGILHLNMFFSRFAENRNQEIDLKSILMPVCYVYKTMKMPSVLKTLKQARQHIAIVTDEYSGTLGIVTMEDVLEQIVGDIWDESDTIERDIVIRKKNEFELDGDLSISEFLELLEISEDDFEADSETVGGWVIEKLDHFPVSGESFEFDNLSVKVLETSPRRVDKVLIKKNDAEN